MSNIIWEISWFLLILDKDGIQQCGLRTKSLLFKTAATCIDQNWHKHCQSVRSTVSPSLPPTTGSDCVSTSNRPLVWPFRVSNWTAVRKQCQDCYPEHSGVYGENLALFTSTQWKLSLQHSAQMELCVADSCLNSLSVTALGLVTTLFSQLCTWFKSCSTFWHDWLQLKEGEFFLSFFNPLNGVVFTEPKMLFTTFNRHLLKTTNYNMTSFFCKDWVTLF